jgi:hypothetical protein
VYVRGKRHGRWVETAESSDPLDFGGAKFEEFWDHCVNIRVSTAAHRSVSPSEASADQQPRRFRQCGERLPVVCSREAVEGEAVQAKGVKKGSATQHECKCVCAGMESAQRHGGGYGGGGRRDVLWRR